MLLLLGAFLVEDADPILGERNSLVFHRVSVSSRVSEALRLHPFLTMVLVYSGQSRGPIGFIGDEFTEKR